MTLTECDTMSTELIEQYLFMLYINNDALPLEELLWYTKPSDITKEEADSYSVNVLNQLQDEGRVQIIMDSTRDAEPIVKLTSNGTLWLERRILR